MDEKPDDKALKQQEDEANLRAATQVNAEAASLTPPVEEPKQLELIPGRACPPEAKPATNRRKTAKRRPDRRDGVQGGGTQRKHWQAETISLDSLHNN